MIILHRERTFRETPGVHFADIGVQGANGLDLVEHSGPSVSPPDVNGRRQWYVHSHQADNNRCIKGHRLFQLYCDQWKDPHWYVMLDDKIGALHIPPGCLHRSYSGNDGSLLLNHAERDIMYDENKEFVPVFSWKHRLTRAKFFNCTPAQVEHFINHGEYLE